MGESHPLPLAVAPSSRNILALDVQRLFSSFADGWPGTGLLLQRLLTGTILLRGAFLEPGPHVAAIMLRSVVSLLLVIGLGTPYIGALLAAVQVWLIFTGSADLWSSIVLCGLGASLAMIGPGAWSMDARFFGRKHVEIVKR